MTEKDATLSAFAQADRISDRIVDILNEEREKPGFNPVHAFAGQLLALLAFSSTSPTPRPRPMANVVKAAGECLLSIMSEPQHTREPQRTSVPESAPILQPNKKEGGE